MEHVAADVVVKSPNSVNEGRAPLTMNVDDEEDKSDGYLIWAELSKRKIAV